jgi:cobalt-zinc-cadmium efflux system outer membrane protein
MRRQVRRLLLTASLAACIAPRLPAQKNLTWEQAKRELEASNPNLRASQIGIQEARADEITAYLRPNPTSPYPLIK